MRRISSRLRGEGRRIAFVPTMGAMHEGHLALMRHARELSDSVVVSVFVNPTQFGPGEDFARYPRRLEADADLARGAGVDHVFAPSEADVYPPGYQTFIEPAELAVRHEGMARPGHFRGVATVVYRLLRIVEPHLLLLGQKDAQQCAVIEILVRDLELPVEVVRRPTVRGPDGVALSSRNAYLSDAERRSARAVPRALVAARAAVAAGAGVADAERAARAVLGQATGLAVEYVIIVDGGDFSEVRAPERALIALAVRVGATRLIDNAWLVGPDEPLSVAAEPE